MTGKQLNIGQCYSIAWKSFAKWWIPICLISAIIFVFQIFPRILVSADVNKFETIVKDAIDAFKKQDIDKLEEISYQLQSQTKVLMRKFAMLWLYTFPFIALLTVVLLMYANWAVKNIQENRKSLSALIYIALIHVILATGKMLAIFIKNLGLDTSSFRMGRKADSLLVLKCVHGCKTNQTYSI